MTDPLPVLIGPTDVRLYNRCPSCDRGPGERCEGIEGVDFLAQVHPDRLAVRVWPDPIPTVQMGEPWPLLRSGESIEVVSEPVIIDG